MIPQTKPRAFLKRGKLLNVNLECVHGVCMCISRAVIKDQTGELTPCLALAPNPR